MCAIHRPRVRANSSCGISRSKNRISSTRKKPVTAISSTVGTRASSGCAFTCTYSRSPAISAIAASASCRSTDADSAIDSLPSRSRGSTARVHASILSWYSRARNLPISLYTRSTYAASASTTSNTASVKPSPRLMPAPAAAPPAWSPYPLRRHPERSAEREVEGSPHFGVCRHPEQHLYARHPEQHLYGRHPEQHLYGRHPERSSESPYFAFACSSHSHPHSP